MMLAIPAFKKLMPEVHKLKANLNYTVRPCLNKQTKVGGVVRQRSFLACINPSKKKQNQNLSRTCYFLPRALASPCAVNTYQP